VGGELTPTGRVSLSSGERVLFPDKGITKADLFAYYGDVAPALVPHLRDRPFTMKRFREGIAAPFFFQKEAPKGMPDWIPTKAFPTRGRDGKTVREVNFPLVNSADALQWMVQMHCIDMNAWLSRWDQPQKPDLLVFDLDPPDDGFDLAVEVAKRIHDRLDRGGLDPHVKTSGAGGVHVLAPLARRSTFAAVRDLAEKLAERLAEEHPDLVTLEWHKEKRRQGVLIDVAQNGGGRTMASVYSVRPTPHAAVSMPLRWEELTPKLDWRELGMDEARRRIEAEGDLFAPVLSAKGSLTRARREALA
jgi:bifunctional non-homologous end joining protein LigD